MNHFNTYQSNWSPFPGGPYGSGMGNVGRSGLSNFWGSLGHSRGLCCGLGGGMTGFTERMMSGWGWGFARPYQSAQGGYGYGFNQGYGQGFNQGYRHGYGYGHHGQVGSSHHGCHQHSAPPKGTWDSEKGGYVVGQSGKVNVDIKEAWGEFDNNLQYRIGNGPWQDIGSSKNTGQTTSIHAPPGSTVQFRINTPQGENFQAGTTKNSDGIDHGQISAGEKGTVIGFEDIRGGGDRDFCDAVIEVSDGRRRHLN